MSWILLLILYVLVRLSVFTFLLCTELISLVIVYEYCLAVVFLFLFIVYYYYDCNNNKKRTGSFLIAGQNK